MAAGGTPRLRGPNATSRSTERSNSCSSGFWKTNPTVAARSRDRPAVGRLAVEQDAARRRPEEPVEVLDEGRLARAVLAEDRDGLARLDRQRDAADGLDAGRVAMDEVLERDADRWPVAGRSPGGRRSAVAVAVRRSARRGRGPAGGPARAAASRQRGRPRSPPRRRPARRSSPAACASRTSVGAGRAAPTPPRPAPPRARRARSARPPVEHEAAVHPAEHARVVLGAQDRASRPGPARRAGRRPPPSPPDRAARSARRGRGRSCPSPRCSRWPPAAARRPTARTARGRRGGRSTAAPASRRSARPSRPAGRPGSRARRRAPRGPSASMPTAGWPASRRRSRPGRAARRRTRSRRPTPR